MAQAQKEFKAKDAIEAAFAVFHDFYSVETGSQPIRNPLLEGIEYLEDDHQWMVTIGFDIGRNKKTGSQMALFNQTTEPIRETRRIYLNANDGTFLRMD